MRYSQSDTTARRPAPDESRLAEGWLALTITYGVVVLPALLVAVAEGRYFFFLVSAVLCAAHALLVGPRGAALLPAQAAKVLAVGALAVALLRAYYSAIHISFAAADLLLLVALVKLYCPHSVRDLRLIEVAAIFQMLVAGVWGLDVLYLPVFVAGALCLMAHFMWLAMYPAAQGGPGAGPSRAPSEVPTRDFLAALVIPSVVVFACTLIVFVMMPRVRYFVPRRMLPAPRVTGFAENVSLWDVGMMRESHDVALRVQFLLYDALEPKPVEPPRLLMRGVALSEYNHGQWFRHRLMPVPPLLESEFSSRDLYVLRDREVPRRRVLQKVSFPGQRLRHLFALYRPLQVVGTFEHLVDWISHDVAVPSRLTPYGEYEVVSLVPQFSPARLREAGTPGPLDGYSYFWDVPQELRPVLARTIEEVEELHEPTTDYDRVVAAESYLLDPQRFRYEYELPPFGVREPVAAFLTETRVGSCEQFSSALALMVRMWGIPSRLVVGYKGGEYDPVSQSYLFRDSHAHAWVEVFFNGLGWVQFDPTPGTNVAGAGSLRERGQLARLLAGARQAVQRAMTMARMMWQRSVIGYDRRQQSRALHALSRAATAVAEDATRVFRLLWPGMPNLGVLQIGLLVAWLAFAALAISLFGRWLARYVARAVRRTGRGPAARLYEEVLAVLRRKGLSRPPHATGREFAERAVLRLRQTNPDAEQVGEALFFLTELYYRSRFGGRLPSQAELERAEEALQLLRRARRAAAEPGR